MRSSASSARSLASNAVGGELDVAEQLSLRNDDTQPFILYRADCGTACDFGLVVPRPLRLSPPALS